MIHIEYSMVSDMIFIIDMYCTEDIGNEMAMISTTLKYKLHNENVLILNQEYKFCICIILSSSPRILKYMISTRVQNC